MIIFELLNAHIVLNKKKKKKVKRKEKKKYIIKFY